MAYFVGFQLHPSFVMNREQTGPGKQIPKITPPAAEAQPSSTEKK
jgi:hypothetical protein